MIGFDAVWTPQLDGSYPGFESGFASTPDRMILRCLACGAGRQQAVSLVVGPVDFVECVVQLALIAASGAIGDISVVGHSNDEGIVGRTYLKQEFEIIALLIHDVDRMANVRQTAFHLLDGFHPAPLVVVG